MRRKTSRRDTKRRRTRRKMRGGMFGIQGPAPKPKENPALPYHLIKDISTYITKDDTETRIGMNKILEPRDKLREKINPQKLDDYNNGLVAYNEIQSTLDRIEEFNGNEGSSEGLKLYARLFKLAASEDGTSVLKKHYKIAEAITELYEPLIDRRTEEWFNNPAYPLRKQLKENMDKTNDVISEIYEI